MIRLDENKDLAGINEIYDQAVFSSFETADMEQITLEEREVWFNQHSLTGHPIYVYDHNGKIAGWLSFSPYRAGRKALRYTAEISYYVHKDFKRQGVGSQLIEFALEAAKRLQFKTLFAIILDKNEASIQLLKKYNFMGWGHLPGVADFNGEACGHVYYGRQL